MATMNKPFQRKDSESNAHVGRDFEKRIQEYFKNRGVPLKLGVTIPIGISRKKLHAFDLGSDDEKILVECKAHRWTEGGNMPSAKVSVWNEAMFFFYVAPPGYRKLLIVSRDLNSKTEETLAEYYVRINSHLIPEDVEVWEYDESNKEMRRIKSPEDKRPSETTAEDPRDLNSE